MTTTAAGVAADSLLVSLIEATERGEQCPDIRLIVGPWVIQGRAVSTEEFLKGTERDFTEQMFELPQVRKLRVSHEEKAALVGEQVQPFMAAFGPAEEGRGQSVNFLGAVVATAGGLSLNIPALRVPLPAVTAWWSTGHEADQAKSRITGGGFGVSF